MANTNIAKRRAKVMEKMDKLIVIEGLDGSGKATQAALLAERLNGMGIGARPISFPDYNQPTSTLVKMYLNGEFGDHPGDVNPYAASSFYAVDRFASFARDWSADYEQGKVIVADRYTTSNAVHQMGKLPREKWQDFIKWLEDYEYGLLKLPRPDQVLFLDMPLEVSLRLMSGRYHGDESRKDIHERAADYLAGCRECALFAAGAMGWTTIGCAMDGEPRAIDEIHNEIMNLIMNNG